MIRFRLGLVLESLGMPLRKALGEAAKLGVQGVQIDAVGDLSPEKLGSTGRREFKTLLRSYSLELVALSCPLRRGLDSFEAQQERLDRIRTAMQLAVDLGAKRINLPLPRIPVEEPKPEEGEEPAPLMKMFSNPPKSAILRESLASLGNSADRLGVRIGLEGGFDSATATRDYLKGFGSETLGFTYDPANFLGHGHDPVNGLMPLVGSTIHVHGRDARTARAAGAGTEEVNAGAGDIDWIGFFATLSVIEYDGFVCAERTNSANPSSDVAASVGFLRRFVLVG